MPHESIRPIPLTPPYQRQNDSCGWPLLLIESIIFSLLGAGPFITYLQSRYRVIISRLAIAPILLKFRYFTISYLSKNEPDTVFRDEFRYCDIRPSSILAEIRSITTFTPNGLLCRYCLIARNRSMGNRRNISRLQPQLAEIKLRFILTRSESFQSFVNFLILFLMNPHRFQNRPPYKYYHSILHLRISRPKLSEISMRAI